MSETESTGCDNCKRGEHGECTSPAECRSNNPYLKCSACSSERERQRKLAAAAAAARNPEKVLYRVTVPGDEKLGTEAETFYIRSASRIDAVDYARDLYEGHSVDDFRAKVRGYLSSARFTIEIIHEEEIDV